jgi:hypothetical protein
VTLFGAAHRLVERRCAVAQERAQMRQALGGRDPRHRQVAEAELRRHAQQPAERGPQAPRVVDRARVGEVRAA